MKKIILYGDGLLAGPAGFGESLVSHFFLFHPTAALSVRVQGGTGIGCAEALREAPFQIIGKAPDAVLFCLGSKDIATERRREDIRADLRALLGLVVSKTRAQIHLVNSCTALWQGDEAALTRCREFNHELLALVEGAHSARAGVVDMDSRARDFLARHREGAGDKHSLHLDPERLTGLGRLFFAHGLYHAITWPLAEAGTSGELVSEVAG